MLNLTLLPDLGLETAHALSASNGPGLTWLMTTSAILILTIGAVAYGFRRLVVR